MKIVTITPLTKGIQKETLTYFSALEIEVGMIVSIKIRNKLVNALVVSVEDASKSKSEVKTATYNLKKIEKIIGPSFFLPEFFKACEETKKYFIGQTGQIINSFLPAIYLKNYDKLQKLEYKEIQRDRAILKQEKLIFQAPLEDRISFYKTFIRESFAKKTSVFLCLPTISDIEFFAENIQKGIENYVYVFHSDVPDKKLLEKYNKVIKEDHPVLIIATSQFLFIPRNDIGAIVLERESSPSHKSLTRPFIDTRTFVEFLSYKLKVKLILADTFLRMETIWRHDNFEFNEISPISFRVPQNSDLEIIDMKKDEDTKFSILSNEVIDLISKSIKENKKIFLFTLRKGLAPITVCHDCSNPLFCDFCQTPLVLKNTEKNGRIFYCNKCKKQKASDTSCVNCGSWNMTPLGIGTELVFEEIKKKFKSIKAFRLDKEKAKTSLQAEKIIDQFYKTKGGVLVGTEMALFYLNEIDYTAIISFDSLFSIPNFKMNEKILNLVSSLILHTDKKLLIQTRNADEKILRHIMSGNLSQVYRDEIEERQKFGYPPFKTIIKVSYRGKKEAVEKEKIILKEMFEEYKPDIFHAFVAKIKGLHIINMVIKIDRNLWTLESLRKGNFDENLWEKLNSLPPAFSIQVDPEDIL
ncbi:MAG: hypothetical protein WDK96_00300 [Candidatus Paceibacterota bacterium]|jgi:primosomal protein N' (replication factor Y)